MKGETLIVCQQVISVVLYEIMGPQVISDTT